VEVIVPTPPSGETIPENIPLDILFEDEHMLVLNKSPDIIVHPARSHNKGTLINALAYHFKHRSTSGGGLSGVGKDHARPGVCAPA
jgi:23S rRNA pseudouridine1911/1915/1917 synthase